MTAFNLISNPFTRGNPAGRSPSAVTPEFNLRETAGLAPTISVPNLNLPSAISALASGAPIQVVKSNSMAALLIGALTIGAVVYLGRK